MSTLEHTYQKGKADGRAEGRAEGRVEGQVEGRADTLLRQFTRRFGAPGTEVVARVRMASIAELDRWADRILDAESLADVLAD